MISEPPSPLLPHLVFLPATAPGDATYGQAPGHLAGWPDTRLHHLCFPTLVWYNQLVRDQAIEQIRRLAVGPLILVGFSKSGLGAWNLARALPELVVGTVIFDAPMVRPHLPPWDTAPFYADDAAWQRDLPLHSIGEYQRAMPSTHTLVLISGRNFHSEMVSFSHALTASGVRHTLESRPDLPHHWNAGWLELGLRYLPG